jgi:hypothetical protein
MIHDIYKSYELNNLGHLTTTHIKDYFSDLLDHLEIALGNDPINQREFCICKTRLQEACFFAIRAASLCPKNQKKE